MRPVSPAALAILVIVAVAAPVQAAEFSISGGPPASGGALGTCATYAISGGGPITGSGACNGSGLGNSSGNSRADFAELGAKATALQANRSESIPSIWESAAFFQDGVTFTSADPLATHVAVSMDLNLDGRIIDFGPGGSSLDMTAEVRLGNQSNYSLAALSPNGSNPLVLQGFSLISGSINPLGVTNAVLRTPTYLLPVNQALGFSLRMASRVGALGSNGLVDFGNTFGAANAGSVFNLPGGATANAGTWLVNNRLASFNPAPGVPEPASWAMLIAGFGLTGATMRRRRPAQVTA